MSFEDKRLKIPANTDRCHPIKTRVLVRRYSDKRLPVFH